jgi:hypothetical protein
MLAEPSARWCSEGTQQVLPINRPLRRARSAKGIVDHGMEAPKKDARNVLMFRDAQAAIAGTLEAWLPRLLESNDALEEALLLLRDLHLERQSVADAVVLKKVDDALSKAAYAKVAF